MFRRLMFAAAVFPALAVVVQSQERSMAQDSTLNNLRLAGGTVTAAMGTFGHVQKVGTGPRTMLLIPGIGFSGDVWADFMGRHKTEYTMYAVTLPGFGGTAPLPMPGAGSSYADTPWIASALAAIDSLVSRERLVRLTIVAHWALATQIALRYAADHPDRVDAVVLVGGVLKAYYESDPAMLKWTPAQRTAFADGIGQGWFRTVTRHTWDDNNFMPYDYAINPRRGLALWREAQAPSLAVWIRYLLEFYAIDPTHDLSRLKVPTLVVQPGFDDPEFYVEDGRNYMRNLCLDSWKGIAPGSQLEFVTIPRSRLFVMFDQPARLDVEIAAFLGRYARRD